MSKQKAYNKVELAKRIGVHYQTINYWIKKGWIEPKRDYRDYPVFTEEQINKIIEWKKTIK